MNSSARRSPAFTDLWVPKRPRALVLVLHGGAEHSTEPVDARSLSWQRARWLGLATARALRSDDIGVALLRYGVKGWNADAGPEPSPLPDARWALDELSERHGVPVAILGHSMGARTGVAVAGHDNVCGVVALAPWLPPGDPVDQLSGRVLRAAHGSADKITSARATRLFLQRAAEVTDATFTDMGPVGHYLLKKSGSWHRWAARSLHEILLPATRPETTP